jgi:nucleolar protein 14
MLLLCLPCHPPGDALGENFDLTDGGEESSDDGSDDGAAVTAANALEARRQAAAAGDHRLQQAFRDAAARLAAKHGVEVPQQGDSEDESEDEGEDEGEDGSEGEGGEGSEGGSDAELGSEQQEGPGSEEGGKSSEQQESESADADDEGQQQQQEAPHPTKALKQQQQQRQQLERPSGKAAAVELEGPLDLSFTPAVPETYQAFEALVGGRPVGQLLLAIQRIRTFNKAALATDSKRKLQASGVGGVAAA